MYRYIACLFLFLYPRLSIHAQIIIKGNVRDAENKAPLAYVNIGISNKNIGTVSLSDGSFAIRIPQQYEQDTLTFSFVGYDELKISIKKIALLQQTDFVLHQKLAQLNEISISSKKLVEKKYGLVKYRPIFHLLDGSVNQDDIFEIAQLIKLGPQLSKITSVNLHINDDRKDSGIFRINFYAYDSSRPGKRIVEKSILQTKAIRDGWMSFDIAKYGIYLKDTFVVAIEFIPLSGKKKRIVYEVKPGGRVKCFVRTSSIGAWTFPPHQYRMFITALSEDDKNNKKEDNEEKDTAPAFRLYSKYAMDSFSIFVHLPADYNKETGKKYPVVFLLDANMFFDNIAKYIEETRTAHPGNEPILVGIGYKDFIEMSSLRDRDYTYPQAAEKDSFKISGGAGRFYDFIEQELAGFISNTYRVDNNNYNLVGHSLGGYFVLYALHRDMEGGALFFRHYISASPSIEYSNQYLVEKFRSTNSFKSDIGSVLYITKGGREDKEEGESDGHELEIFNAFTKLLSAKAYKGIKIEKEIFPRAGHMEMAVPSFEKGLDMIMKNKQ